MQISLHTDDSKLHESSITFLPSYTFLDILLCYIMKHRYISCKRYTEQRVTSAFFRTFTSPGFLISSPGPGAPNELESASDELNDTCAEGDAVPPAGEPATLDVDLVCSRLVKLLVESQTNSGPARALGQNSIEIKKTDF